MIWGSVGLISGLRIGLFLKLTPSISSDPALELGGVLDNFASSARFLYELLRMIFSFSACIPLMFGGVVKSRGGVGGTSPVTLTRASIPAHNNFKAVTGPIVKTSRLFGDADLSDRSLGDAFTARPASSEGFGRGGRMYVNESAESWTSVLIGETVAEPVEQRVLDMIYTDRMSKA
jgi:hypothetical protein